jgi:hypothetical protein
VILGRFSGLSGICAAAESASATSETATGNFDRILHLDSIVTQR